jgi:hypothetical protein
MSDIDILNGRVSLIAIALILGSPGLCWAPFPARCYGGNIASPAHFRARLLASSPS